MYEETESTMLFDIMVDSVDFGITDTCVAKPVFSRAAAMRCPAPATNGSTQVR